MFKEIQMTDIKENAVDLIKNQWALVTAGNQDRLNTMTVSWGAVGELWGKDTVTVYIRESRYTKEFLDNEEYFSFCVLPRELKSVHSVCGAQSGRDVDKVKACCLMPNFSEAAPYFDEAKLVIVCKKVAVSKLEPSQFKDAEIDGKWYSEKDYHYVYYGAVEKVFIHEQ